jgi:hypothetical protein
MPFAHEKLHVYQKGLARFASLRKLLPSWSKRHAFVDHLSRAMESMLFNLVEAVRLHDTGKKLLALDYAVGSTCECAACLDIAMLKKLLDTANAAAAKLAVSLDMGAQRGAWHVAEVAHAKELLLRVGQMTARKGYA